MADPTPIRTASFDLLDTLLVRPVLHPRDVFRLVARDLAAPGWTEARIAAERAARAATPTGEVTLDEIYAAAPFARWADRLADFRAAELRWESQMQVDPVVGARVAAARRAGAQILYVSDMYLPRDFLLARLAPVWEPGDQLLVSHEAGDSKGRGWWARLSTQFARPWHHLGDHPRSDYDVPRRHGIEAELWTRSRPTAGERALAADNPERPLAGGLARLARLSRPPDRPALWDDGADVSGPLFYGFVDWVLRTAAQQQVGCVYFLSRDGQLPCAIARLVRDAGGSAPEVRYLCGSRHAWYRATFDPANARHRSWICDTPRASARDLLANMEIRPEEVAPPLQRCGVPPERWDSPLTVAQQRRLLAALSTEPEASARFDDNRRRSLETTLAYLRQEQVFDHARIALVDIGWRATMLDALQQLIASHPGPRPAVIGCFFGLHRGTGADRHTYQPEPRLWPHWSISFPSVIEMLAPGDHGQTLRYATDAARRVVPVFAPDLVAPANAVSALHAGALRYVASAIAAREPPPRSGRLLREFLVHPDRDQRKRWSEFRFWTFQRPGDGAAPPLFGPMPVPRLLRRLASPQRHVAAWPWPTATLLATWPTAPSWLCALLVAKLQCDRFGWNLLLRMTASLRKRRP